MRNSLPPQTHLEKLKAAAMYLSLKRALRSSARFGIGWGLFTLAMGIITRPQSLLDLLWFSIGFYLLLQGIWILRSPSLDPRMVLSESVALLLLGLWNTVGIYIVERAGGKVIFAGHAVIFGILQLISAYSMYSSYPSYKIICQQLDTLASEELERFTEGVWKSKPGESPDTIELKTAGLLSSGDKLKAKLMPEYVILLGDKGGMIRVYGKAEVTATHVSKKRLSKSLDVTLHMDDEEYKTEMKPADFDRLRLWAPGAFQGTAQERPPSSP